MSLVAQVAEAAKFSDASTVMVLSAARGDLHQVILQRCTITSSIFTTY
jgi:hypothetical protein